MNGNATSVEVGAIVLTGGRASRLGGVDKARLPVAGQPMVETVLRAARAVAGPVVTVGPGGDTREEPPHSGPVAGIAAGLPLLPGEVDVVVVVACDLPGLDAETLAALVDSVRTARAESAPSTFSAALGVDATGHDQYLLAAWDRRALAARLDALERSGGVGGRPVRALYDDDNNDTADYDDIAGAFLRVYVGDHALDVDTWSDLAARGPVALAHVGPVLAAGLETVPATEHAPFDAVGSVLAAPLVAAEAMPRGRVSAMDGYALAGSGPWRLTGAARRAGDESAASLEPGCAAPIATGALAPTGTDRVLRHELVKVLGSASPAADTSPSPGAAPGAASGAAPALVTALPAAEGVNDLRPVGEDWLTGHDLAPPGTVLDAALASAALSAGLTKGSVRGPVRATVVTTGDEVMPASTPSPLPDGRIRDTVGPLLGAVLARAGFAAGSHPAAHTATIGHYPARPTDVEHCPDTEADFESLLHRPRAAGDVLVLVGATGRGVADHLRPALERAGARILIDGVRVRPGGSQIVAMLPGGGILLGLPGNPLAAVCAAATTGRALVDALTGRQRNPMLVTGPGLAGLPAAGRARILPARPDGAGGWSIAGQIRTAHLADLAGSPSLALLPEAYGGDAPVELVDWI
ncbi:NTP transferase domain-containing protein [uncultured Dietzia sp.]|uniref:NTP transferase domain-containing protein n=2 Tax=Dietzia TaxID=37914 RepID=UPI002626EC26|nr:NTP transferase domain-containing protein [uncultured Dietzia sp.]